MNPQRSFVRKIIYVAAIAVLLAPMYWLSRPSVLGAAKVVDPGGKLAQLRDTYQLGQTALGGIDPASETLKLATLGLRGVAVNILWTKANDYKMKKDFTQVSATLEQIAKLEPNFVSVWRHQSWNLAFNCSAEFDDYRQRYRWVIRGLNYLREGMSYNTRAPILQWDMGFMIFHKIGKSDEKKQFRRLFKDDDAFHGERPRDERDNFLVAREWYLAAEELVDHQGAVLKGQAELIYRSDAPLSLMYYAEALENDGTFGEVAKRAWHNAAADWDRYGSVEVPTGFDKRIRLGEKEMFEERAKKATADLEALQPGLRQRLYQAKLAKLPEALRKALAVPLEKRTPQQLPLAAEAEQRVAVTPAEIARNISGKDHKQARLLAEEIEQAEETIAIIRSNRETVNYDYWRSRAKVEQDDDTIRARTLIHAGDLAFADSQLVPARENYEQGLKIWRKVIDKYPELLSDRGRSDDLPDMIKRYKKILNQMELPMPDPFILKDVLKAHPERQ